MFDLAQISETGVLEPIEDFIILALDRLIREIRDQRRLDVVAVTTDALESSHEFHARLFQTVLPLQGRNFHG